MLSCCTARVIVRGHGARLLSASAFDRSTFDRPTWSLKELIVKDSSAVSREDLERAAQHSCLDLGQNTERHLAASVPRVAGVLDSITDAVQLSQDIRRIVSFCQHVQAATATPAAAATPAASSPKNEDAVTSPLREDVAANDFDATAILGNAARTIDGYFVLPAEKPGSTGRRKERTAEE